MEKKVYLIPFVLTIWMGFLLFQQKEKVNQFIKPIPAETVKTKTTSKIDEEPIILISTGDIGLVRDVNYRIQQKRDVNYPFLKISEYLNDADLTITNLEGPLIKNCPVILTGFKFCGDALNVKGLSFAGIDAVSLANNHTTNYGLEGLRETVNTLEREGIISFGIDDLVKYTDIKGKKFALIGFVELNNEWAGLNNATAENVSKLVAIAGKNSDAVITSFHWGAEYSHDPTENQILLAHLAVDSGADIVLGNHPHWIQISEIYKEKFITYAQGNTIFDQDWSQETKEGVIYKFVYKNGNFEKIDEKYTVIEDNSQPRFATDEETRRIKKCVINNCPE